MKSRRRFPFPYLLFVILLTGFLLWKSYFVKEVFEIQPRGDFVSKQTFDEEKNDFKTIGWLRVQGTSLDLPVVHSNEQNYNYPVGTKSYTWTSISDGKFHNAITIMGHNVYNLSATPKLTSDKFFRFEELMSFIYYDFAKENEYFQLTIGDNEYVYKIFAVTFLDGTDELYLPSGVDYDKNDMKYFVSYLKKRSFYRYNVAVSENDSVASLVTCTRFYGVDKHVQLYVTGRLLRMGEKMKNYKVYKNKNYEEIENILRGDLDEEENV